MPRFYEPDLGADPNSPFARDASNKLVRRYLHFFARSMLLVKLPRRPNVASRYPVRYSTTQFRIHRIRDFSLIVSPSTTNAPYPWW